MELEYLFISKATVRKCTALLLIVSLLLLSSGCLFDLSDRYPADGLWRCDELSLTLNFNRTEDGRHCKPGFREADGTVIPNEITWDGGESIFVSCEYPLCSECKDSGVHYVFDYLQKTDQQMKLKEYNQRIVYTFYRVE